MKQYCDYIMESNFYVSHNCVIPVKSFLDKMCVINLEPDIVDGYPTDRPNIYLVNPRTKEPVRPIEPREVLFMLDEKFPKIVKDDYDRRLYLKQIIIDWFDEKINRQKHKDYLSVNSIERKK